jgi:uncharacterized damage-inducible protein DinB
MAQHTMPGPKEQFLKAYKDESATTRKIMHAFPADQAEFKPHERSNSALKLMWTFVVEQNVVDAALNGPLNLTGQKFPPPPATIAEVIAAYEKAVKGVEHSLARVPDSRLHETVTFFTGPKQMGDVPVLDLMWFMLMDSIHHRGQLSVYVRMAGGKVPSIYGPSADEPWN